MTTADTGTGTKTALPQALVVEDGDDLRRMLCLMLNELGFNAVGVGNADAALALLQASEPFDLLLTDVNMPGSIDGSVLAAMVRQLYPGTAIVVATALPGQSLASLPEDVAVLPKPFHLKELAARIEHVKARSTQKP